MKFTHIVYFIINDHNNNQIEKTHPNTDTGSLLIDFSIVGQDCVLLLLF